MSVRYVVKRLYNFALPPNYSTNIHLVKDAAVVSLLATAPILSLQVYNLRQASKMGEILKAEVAAVQEDVDTIEENMVTREDIKDSIDEIARQYPCLEDVNSGFAREHK